jgi:branched-chain amino acid transport system permease protein
VIAAGMAGIAGGLWAYYIQFAVSTNWDFSLTISLITYVVVGGITSPYGGLVGALVVGTLQYYVQYHTTTAGSNSSSNWQVVMNGAFLVVFLLLFRNGLVPVLSVDAMKRRFVRLRGGSPPEPTTGGPRAEPPPVASLAVGQSDDSREDRLA